MQRRAFVDRQFRLFFSGVAFSVQAIWMQRVTIGWVAWDRTGSPAFVGLVAAMTLVPSLVAGPLFGVMADRSDIRRAAIITNGAMATILALLALLLPVIGPVGLVIGALGIGTTAAAGHPVRMSLGPRLVPSDLVSDVVAMTALLFNVARLVSPMLTGVIIAGAGPQITLALAALLYAPILIVLPRLQPRPVPAHGGEGFLTALMQGVAHVWRDPLVRLAFYISLIVATIGRGALELLPVLADGAFARGATGLGILTAAAGGGALIAAVLKAAGVGADGARIPASVVLVVLAGMAGVAGMGLAPVWWLAVGAVAAVGCACTYVAVTLQAAIQTGLPDGLRGRVMSLWTVVGFGTVALGAAGIGALAQLAGIQAAMVMAGAAGAAATIPAFFPGGTMGISAGPEGERSPS